MDRELPYRAARDVEDALAFERLLVTCFAVPPEHAGVWVQRVGLESVRLLGADPVLAGLGILTMGQWFGGRRVACAGIAAVGVAPEHRGRGLGTRLMSSALCELAQQKVALSCLYPATLPIYRAVGYEIAGLRYEMKSPCASLVSPRGNGEIVAIAGTDDEAMRACQREAAARGNGELDRHEALWLRVGEHRGEARDGYAVRAADGRVTGYVWFARRPSSLPRHDLSVSDCVALDRDAARTLIGFLHGHRSMVNDVVWCGGASDPLRDALTEADWTMRLHSPWMLRIVDVEAALSSRGYPRSVRAVLHLDLDDPVIAGNRGRFVLDVADGLATLRRGGEGRVALAIGDLASIYSAHASAEARSHQGSVRGDPRDLALMSSLFAGPPPAMPDMF